MKHGEKVAPIAALLSAGSSLACCLPFGFAAAAGFAGAAVVLDRLRPWLMFISAALLLLGVWQFLRRPRVCAPRSRTFLALFWICAAVVLALWIAPQTIAGLLAGGSRPGSHMPLAIMDLAALRTAFNAAADRTRVIVLFSPG